jgi:hypothetical protein
VPDLTKAASGATKATSTISSAVSGMSDNVKVGFAAAAGAAASFGAALAVVQAGGSKSMAILSGTISSAIAGITAAMAFTGPVGAIVGGISMVGTLLGALFGGKSAAQKEQERLNNEKLKADIAASAQATMNAALEGFQKALQFLDQLDQFTAPRKAKFQQFFKSLSKLMDFFVELARKWQGENLDKDKAVAEAIGAVAEGIAKAPAAFDAINTSFTLPDSQFDVFFNNLDRFMQKFFARSEVWIEGTAKRAMKVADRLKSVVDLVAPFVDGLKGMVDLKPISDDAFNIFDQMLTKMVEKIGQIADRFDKGWLKTLAFFAEKAQAALSLWKDATDAIRATVDLPALDPSLIDVVVANIELFIAKLVAAAERINSESLGKAASLANSIMPIANALKAWAEAAKVVHDYSAVANETWQNISTDFERAIALINMMLASAIEFLPRAVQFENVMKEIADHLKAGLISLAEGLAAAASAFGAVVNLLQGGPVNITLPGDSSGTSSTSAAALSLPTGSYAPSAATTVHYHYHVSGSLVYEQQLDERIARGVTNAQQRRLIPQTA